MLPIGTKANYPPYNQHGHPPSVTFQLCLCNVNKANTNISNSKPTATTKKEETHKHFMQINAGWFKSVDELEKEVDREFEKWDRKYNASEITWDELGKYCPIRIRNF